MTGRFLPYPAIYAVYKLAQPPDSRTYSAEVTSFLSNLPHHRRLRPIRRPVIIQHPPVCVKRFCKKILADFPGFPNAGHTPLCGFFRKRAKAPSDGQLVAAPTCWDCVPGPLTTVESNGHLTVSAHYHGEKGPPGAASVRAGGVSMKTGCVNRCLAPSATACGGASIPTPSVALRHLPLTGGVGPQRGSLRER